LAKFIAGYLQIDRTAPVALLSIALFVGLLVPAFIGLLQGLQKFFWIGISHSGAALTRLGVGGVFIFLGLGLNGAVGASVVSTFAALLIASFPLRPFLRRSDDVRADSSVVKRYFVPVVLFLIFQSLLSFIDGIVVKHYFDPEQAAAYFRAAIVGKAFLYLPGRAPRTWCCCWPIRPDATPRATSKTSPPWRACFTRPRW
jgi:O-antigen/teichoic acid export membrane protein